MDSFIDSPENITGLSGIVNKKKVKKNIDLGSIERDMLRSFKSPKDAKDAATDFKGEMLKLTKESGIDFGETWDPDDMLASDDDNDGEIAAIDDEVIFGKNEPIPRYNPSMNLSDIRSKNMKKKAASVDDVFASDDDEDEDDPMPQRGTGARNVRYRSREHQQYTEDQQRQKNIDQFMDNIEDEDGEVYDMETAELEDDKHRLLDRIDTLRTILEEDDVDVSHIPEVDQESTYDEVKYVHRMLDIKNDSRRCSSLAEEGVLMIAYALEDVFDGKRTFFGSFRPNLVGWHTTAQNKLRRMRYETSTIVSDTLKSHNVGHIGRIGLELIPSMIIYSKRKQSASTEQDLVDSKEFNDALRDIRNK